MNGIEKKIIAKVTEEEKKKIESIFEHREALKCLVSSLSDDILKNNNELYEKLVCDTIRVNYEYKKWWEEKSKKYSWDKRISSKLMIDFSTNEIILISND